jgi:hypothetical protein
MSQWNEILTAEQLAAHYAMTGKIDTRFAMSEQEFYSTRSIAQLRALSCGAWTANDAYGYQMARSYLALAVRYQNERYQTA